MARPVKYIEGIHGPWAKSLAMEGLTDKEMADRMGIAKSTFNKWKKDFPEFSDSIKMGKEPADANVEQTLYKRAIGYTIKEKKVVVEMDSEGNQKPARIETFEKQVIPDTTAQIFWLKNRRPKDWRDKQDISLTIDPFTELMKAAAQVENDD